MTIIDIYGRRYIVEVFKEAIVSLSYSRSDKFEVISSLREDIFFFHSETRESSKNGDQKCQLPSKRWASQEGIGQETYNGRF